MMMVDGRRLVRAVGLASLLFVLVGGGIGFVAAEGEEPGLLLPEPRPGDRAVYTVARAVIEPEVALGGPGDAPLDEVTYEWLPERWVRDAAFGERLGRPLHAHYLFNKGGNEV